MAKKYDAREISISLEDALLEDIGKTAFAIARNLILASPVGNPTLWQNPASAPPGYVGGHFRRNWIVSIGGFKTQVIPGQDANGASTLGAARSVINAYEKGRPGPSLVIQNNVPYARRLANGFSTQASTGWVDEAVRIGVNTPGGRRDLG